MIKFLAKSTIVLVVIPSLLAACAPGTGALLYCLAVDHDINRKCQ